MMKLLLPGASARLGLGLALCGAAFALPPLFAASAPSALPPAVAPPAPPAPEPLPLAAPAFDAGRSGALMASIASPGGPTAWRAEALADGWSWAPVDPEGERTQAVAAEVDGATLRLRAPETPGAYRLRQGEAPADGPVLFVRVPFEAKHGGKVDAYVMGRWPGEAGTTSPYPLPDGFVRMTEAMVDVPLSPRLKLGNFKTKNQAGVWPKYLVLSIDLVDKLELIAADLRAQGLPGSRLFVMSGFRTPAYNAPGVGAGGRATWSRHQFGDAADVWVDDDGDGRMDDLNRDGRSDTGDARVMLAAQERVEAAWPDLVGGGGVYQATPAHGPFLHVDVRGSVARWGHL